MFSNEAIKQLRGYPPSPSKSRYRRTFKLRKGWKKEISSGSNELGVSIFNRSADYAGWVQGRRFTGDQRQLRRFTEQGWVSLTDINRKVWPIYELRIARALGIRRHRVRNIRV